MNSDAGSPFDPYLFVVGFGLLAAGLVLSQFHRDQGLLLKPLAGLAFNLVRKMAGLSVLLSLITGFWIVGWVWIFWAAMLGFLAPGLLQQFQSSRRLAGVAVLLCLSGMSLMSWAQSPLLRAWGVIPQILP